MVRTSATRHWTSPTIRQTTLLPLDGLGPSQLLLGFRLTARLWYVVVLQVTYTMVGFLRIIIVEWAPQTFFELYRF